MALNAQCSAQEVQCASKNADDPADIPSDDLKSKSDGDGPDCHATMQNNREDAEKTPEFPRRIQAINVKQARHVRPTCTFLA